MFKLFRKKKLVRNLKSFSASERRESAENLLKMQWEPLNDLDRAYFYCALGKWNELETLKKFALSPLINALTDENTRNIAFDLILKIKPDVVTELMPLLFQLINETSKEVKKDKRIEEIINVFIEIGDTKAIPSVLDTLFIGLYTDVCVKALKSFGDKALDDLINVLSSGIKIKDVSNGKVTEVEITDISQDMLLISELIASGNTSLSDTLREQKGISLDVTGARRIVNWNKMAQDYLTLIGGIILEIGPIALSKVELLRNDKRPMIKKLAEKIIVQLKNKMK